MIAKTAIRAVRVKYKVIYTDPSEWYIEKPGKLLMDSIMCWKVNVIPYVKCFSWSNKKGPYIVIWLYIGNVFFLFGIDAFTCFILFYKYNVSKLSIHHLQDEKCYQNGSPLY